MPGTPRCRTCRRFKAKPENTDVYGRKLGATLVLAMRFPIFASMAQLCIWTSSSQHINQHMKITLGASVRMSGEIGYEKEVEKPLFYGMFVVVSAFARTRAQVNGTRDS